MKREAAAFSVKWWHYSNKMPSGKNFFLGVWEGNRFIGVVIFGRGANRNIGSPWELSQEEVCELVRVALAKHETPTSRIVALAIKQLRKKDPNLKAIVSYADMKQNHVGTLYQAGGWIYLGESKQSDVLFQGRVVHKRGSLPSGATLSQLRKIDPRARLVEIPPKHRYVMPLCEAVRERAVLDAKPYPKKAVLASTAEARTDEEEAREGSQKEA